MRCGGYQIYVAKPFAWGIIFFLLLSSSFVVSHPRRSNEANGLPGIFVPYPASQAPLSPSTTPQPPHPTPPSCPTPEHSSQLTPHSDFRSRFRYRKRCFSVEHRTLSSCSCSRVYLGLGRLLLFPLPLPFAPLCEPPFVPPGADVESDPDPEPSLAFRAWISAETPSSVWRAPMRARQRSTTWYSFASVLSASSACSCVAYTGDLDDDDGGMKRDGKDVSGVIG